MQALPEPVKEGIGVVSIVGFAMAAVMFLLWVFGLWRNRRLAKKGQELTFDELTGALRRVAGLAALDREIKRARRNKTPLSLAFVDVDGLKRTNDTLGHAAGDALLKGVASRLNDRLRGADLIFRYGGDEFVCVLPEADQVACERVFRSVRSAAAEGGFVFTYGVASLRPEDDASTLLARADAALYDTRAEERGTRAAEAGGQMRLQHLDLEPQPEG